MARRSDYPFRKSDMKFGNNLIALLFSIPISLGAKAVIDGSKDLFTNLSNDATKISSNKQPVEKIGGVEFTVGVVGLLKLLALGVYLMCLPEGYAIVSFLGEILTTVSLVLLIFCISVFVSQRIKETRTEYDIEDIHKGYKWMEIDDVLANIFYQSLNVELYFHFTRPLLPEEEYKKIKSKRFKKNLKTYQEYKMAWHRFYWNYSFQMKVHNVLRDTVQSLRTSSHMMSEQEFYYYMDRALRSQLNNSESDFYKTEVQDIKLCCSYHFVAEKIVPFKDDEKEFFRRLNWDLKNRKEKFLREIYLSYAGSWKPELLKQLEDYEASLWTSDDDVLNHA